MNVFVKPNEQCRACSDIVMARKRTFEERKKNKLATALTQRCANAVASQFAMRTQSSANARPA